MKVLLTHRYYAPDTPAYATMLRTIAEGLAGNTGHAISVFASMPSYRGRATAPRREDMNGVSVRRLPVFAEKSGVPGARALNVLIYCLGLAWHILRQRPDVVTASTFPPVFAGWTASLAARIVGARFIYHMQDVHPEVSRISGGLMGRGIAFRLLRTLDNRTLRRAGAIVVLSEDMAETLRARGLGPLPIHVINNFALDAFGERDTPPETLLKPDGRRRVIFAGNLGRFQNLDVLVGGVVKALEQRPDTELLLLGDGDALPSLKQRWANHPQVRFGPFLPFAQAAPLMHASDVGLVSLTSDIYRVSFPSKVLTYSALHLPMLALVEPQSHLAQTIATERLGVVPAAPTSEAVASALGKLLDGPDLKAQVADWDQAHNSIPSRLQAWAGLIAEKVA